MIPPLPLPRLPGEEGVMRAGQIRRASSNGPVFVRVVAPHFVAGIEFANGKVTETAPILAWAKGKTEAEMRTYFAKKGWRASIIDPVKHTVQL